MGKIYNKLLIVDGSYMIHRVLHIPEMFELKNPLTGERTGGCFGMFKTLNAEIKKNGAYFPIVVFDNGLSERRLKADPKYKHADERVEDNSLLTPEELDNDYVTQYRTQRNKLTEILPYFGIPVLKFKGWEGDDLQKILTDMSVDSIVLTDDRDMLQLLNEECRVRRPMANEMWTHTQWVQEKGFEDISDFIIYKAINGDASDSIPGSCKGVGAASVNDFIKLLKLFRLSDGTFDFTEFPKDIDSMKEFCGLHEIKYKKAYLNFDSERFNINMELVDLTLVEKDVTSDLIQSIIATVENSSSNADYFRAVSALNEMAIKDFSADELITAVSMRKPNLMK